MAGLGDAVKHLYSQFILRDVLSAITPGAIVVFTGAYLLSPDLLSLSRSIHWLLYIPLFGLLYMVGFAVECLGRILGIIQIHRLDKSRLSQRLRVFWPGWEDRDDTLKENWRKHQEEEADVENALKQMGIEAEQLTRERLIVLKQMCSAGFLAIVIAGVFLIIKLLLLKLHVSSGVTFIVSMGIVGVVLVILLASLYWGYRWAKLAVDTREPKILSMLKNNQENKKES